MGYFIVIKKFGLRSFLVVCFGCMVKKFGHLAFIIFFNVGPPKEVIFSEVGFSVRNPVLK